ncbi:putative transposable element [Trichonephila clavipes]|nr:putative transposable element [Trichonephila clavipes]
MVDFHKRILFSDEAHFWLNGYVNKQNCRIWSEANPQVYVETPLHPEKLTVWCALWAGGIIGPYFFKTMKATTFQSMSLVYADKPQTLDHLEDNIRRVIADIRPQMLEKSSKIGRSDWTTSEPAVAVLCQKSYLNHEVIDGWKDRKVISQFEKGLADVTEKAEFVAKPLAFKETRITAPLEDVKKIIKAKINPAESKLGVCDLEETSRGNKLLVKCFSENDRDRLLTEIQEKSPELKVSVPKRRNPAIIVKNVPNEVKNEDLLKVITERNLKLFR